jgi:catechol 2,3-dioxygenase-like lactoylglutathione lyase family enzyme
MFNKIDCVAIYTENIEQSIEFYKTLGLTKSWELNRQGEVGLRWTLVGMDFPLGGAQLVLQNDPNLKVVHIEIKVEDVALHMSNYPRIKTFIGLKSRFQSSLGM